MQSITKDDDNLAINGSSIYKNNTAIGFDRGGKNFKPQSEQMCAISPKNTQSSFNFFGRRNSNTDVSANHNQEDDEMSKDLSVKQSPIGPNGHKKN